MPRIELDLPVPPSVNKRAKGLGVHLKARKAWLDAAGWELAAARPKMPLKALPAGRYGVRIRWSTHDPADGDNRVKPLLDFLKRHGVTPDDKHCRHFSIGYSLDVPIGRCRVRVWSRSDG